MSQHSVEIHLFLLLFVLLTSVLQFIILSIMVVFAANIKAIRMKLKLLGFRLTTKEENNDG